MTSQWCALIKASTIMGQFRIGQVTLIDSDYTAIVKVIFYWTVVCDIAVLQTFMHMCVVTMLLLLLCGDIEMNPVKPVNLSGF